MKKFIGILVCGCLFQGVPTCQVADTFEGDFVLNALFDLEGTVLEVIVEP